MDKEKLEIRRKEKQQQLIIARMDAEKNQKPISSIVISIEWKKSKTWGVNPHCTAKVYYKDGTYETSPIYTATGCGYDKGSTVIAQVFNNYLKYKLWMVPSEEHAPYGIVNSLNNKRYANGVGVDCYYEISNYIGGKLEQIASGTSFDVYKYTDLE